MSEEEKIKKYLKVLNEENTTYKKEKARQGLLDLYNKQKEENNTLKELLQGKLFENYQYYKDLASSYQANCVSKDKIRDEIKKLEQMSLEDDTFGKMRDYAILILKELLEEK